MENICKYCKIMENITEGCYTFSKLGCVSLSIVFIKQLNSIWIVKKLITHLNLMTKETLSLS